MNSERQRRHESERCLCVRRGQGRKPDGTGSEGVLRGVEHKERRENGADEVADEGDRPVLKKCAGCHLPARPSHDNQVVAGEQLASSDDNQDEPSEKTVPAITRTMP